MKNLFCSYEQSLAFKELGFKETCLGLYDIQKRLFNRGVYEFIKKETNVLAPLKSQVFKWFRDKDIYCIVYKNHDGFFYEVYGEELQIIKGLFNTYEEAEDACIDKLIELIKTNKK